MSTSDLQARHLHHVAVLIQWAHSNGYKLTAGDAYRDPRAHGRYGGGSGCAGYSASKSNHKHRLAHDFNLFIDAHQDDYGLPVGGMYAQDSAAYRPLAVYWESLDKQNKSGMRYNGDANHFETVSGYDNRKDTPL